MNANPIIMSSGELESGTAGRPGYLIRRRYRDAADRSKTRGVLSALMINDLDAGIGLFEARGLLLRACCKSGHARTSACADSCAHCAGKAHSARKTFFVTAGMRV
jgi:hypothetical protein